MGSDSKFVMVRLVGLIATTERPNISDQMYHISVKKGNLSWTIFRRYNQFFDLDHKVRKTYFECFESNNVCVA